MSISKILYQTLCVFSQMKDTKHIRHDFHSVTLVMSQGWDFEALGVPRGSFFKHGHVAYQIGRDDKQNKVSKGAKIRNQNASKIFILGSNW